MDHYFQIEVIGPAQEPMLEGYTTLGFLAAHTSRARLGLLVTGVTYRHPGLLAKIVTTLDVLSGGRAELGIGAAWYDREHAALGVPFPSLSERFERLEETLQIVRQMWSDDDGPYQGTHYRLAETLCSPPPVSRPRPRILIGGMGEKKTLRLVARYADACNIFAFSPEMIQGKLDVLRRHCDEPDATTTRSPRPSCTWARRCTKATTTHSCATWSATAPWVSTRWPSCPTGNAPRSGCAATGPGWPRRWRPSGGDRPELRQATPAEYQHLRAVEHASDALFLDVGIGPFAPGDDEDRLSQAVVVFASGNPAVGFASVEVIDGAAHIWQLSVDPAFGRQGRGRALVERVCEWARGQGLDSVTLTTFRDVPWNAPFYARMGFEIEAAPSPGLAAIRREEVEGGDDDHGPRVAMRKDLRPD